ncbi:DNA-binding transcriptional ArsR family regulator [Rhizobium mesoamericanum]|uniref:ArsR/SmtB family transcription factor n=1 Tax=Rhizobium mesoamericanum TaxID=1079800 RepID=UPI0027881BA2|nr:metalloregulator ArsR/SmtB family transcription factor [Rhizobium mesoamericanum]MDQ0561563.1 DNA-binding transcriptional ArsR family regulator [Rhizobium mesoamericanum]
MSGTALPFEQMQERVVEAAEFMRLFSTPGRLMLLCHIAQRERSVGEIQEDLGLKQPALSQQLAELRQAGLVETRRQSRQVYYSISDGRVAMVMDMLMQMFCEVTPRIGTSIAPVGPSTRQSRGRAGTTFLGEMAHKARLEETD